MAYNNRRKPKSADDTVQIQGLSVEVRNGDFNKALRLFKKKVQEDGILQELREREFYEKPTTKRNKAKKAARNRWLKKLRKMEDQLGYNPQASSNTKFKR
jgi:small subunit ribosomal protein S21